VFTTISLSRFTLQCGLLAMLLGVSLPGSAGSTYDLCVMFFTRDYREVAKDMCLQCRYQKFTGQPADPDCIEAQPGDKAATGKQDGAAGPQSVDKPTAGK
jgi:hypothetical protein